jgi:hypothetical protein
MTLSLNTKLGMLIIYAKSSLYIKTNKKLTLQPFQGMLYTKSI